MNSFKEAQAMPVSTYFNRFILQVYGFMTLGLLVTAMVTAGVFYLSLTSRAFYNTLDLLSPFIFILEIVVVIFLAARAQKINGLLALGLFIFYAFLNGVFFGNLMQDYNLQSIIVAFFATFLTFGVMSLYGLVTKSDLTKVRSIAIMGLIALLIGTFFNIIISFISPALGNGLYWILTYAGLGLFVVLVVVDTKRLKDMALRAETTGGNIMSYTIQGALVLYLDFINLFLRILAIGGRKR